jgi:hypothetical protein
VGAAAAAPPHASLAAVNSNPPPALDLVQRAASDEEGEQIPLIAAIPSGGPAAHRSTHELWREVARSPYMNNATAPAPSLAVTHAPNWPSVGSLILSRRPGRGAAAVVGEGAVAVRLLRSMARTRSQSSAPGAPPTTAALRPASSLQVEPEGSATPQPPPPVPRWE